MSTSALSIPRHAASRPSRPLSELAVTVRRDAASVMLTPSGALDTYTVAAFRNVVEQRDIACDDLVIDLDHVTLIDSAGLHTLRTLSARARASGHRLVLVCGRADIRSALAIGGMKASVPAAGSEPPGRCGLADQDSTAVGRGGHRQTVRSLTQALSRIGRPEASPGTAGVPVLDAIRDAA